MARYTKKDSEGRYYIESANGKLESNIKGHTYGEAIDRLSELENANVAPIADTVRKMQERLKMEIAKYFLPSLQLQANAFIDQIANEIIKGEIKNEN